MPNRKVSGSIRASLRGEEYEILSQAEYRISSYVIYLRGQYTTMYVNMKRHL